MKDAKGHGSNAGVHASGITSLPRTIGKYRVERQGGLVKTAAGQRVTTVGAVWEKMTPPKRRAVAEKIAQNMRVDNPNGRFRLR